MWEEWECDKKGETDKISKLHPVGDGEMGVWHMGDKCAAKKEDESTGRETKGRIS